MVPKTPFVIRTRRHLFQDKNDVVKVDKETEIETAGDSALRALVSVSVNEMRKSNFGLSYKRMRCVPC